MRNNLGSSGLPCVNRGIKVHVILCPCLMCMLYWSHILRKLDFYLCENKAADQLCSYCIAQHLCFCYMDSTIPLLPKSKISSFEQSSVAVHAGLCQTWLETLNTVSLLASHWVQICERCFMNFESCYLL